MAFVTQTDCPKSVRNRYVIEGFPCVCVLSGCFWGFSVGVEAFVIGLSQIFSLWTFSLKEHTGNCHRCHADALVLGVSIYAALDTLKCRIPSDIHHALMAVPVTCTSFQCRSLYVSLVVHIAFENMSVRVSTLIGAQNIQQQKCCTHV